MDCLQDCLLYVFAAFSISLHISVFKDSTDMSMICKFNTTYHELHVMVIWSFQEFTDISFSGRSCHAVQTFQQPRCLAVVCCLSGVVHIMLSHAIFMRLIIFYNTVLNWFIWYNRIIKTCSHSSCCCAVLSFLSDLHVSGNITGGI